MILQSRRDELKLNESSIQADEYLVAPNGKKYRHGYCINSTHHTLSTIKQGEIPDNLFVDSVTGGRTLICLNCRTYINNRNVNRRKDRRENAPIGYKGYLICPSILPEFCYGFKSNGVERYKTCPKCRIKETRYNRQALSKRRNIINESKLDIAIEMGSCCKALVEKAAGTN